MLVQIQPHHPFRSSSEMPGEIAEDSNQKQMITIDRLTTFLDLRAENVMRGCGLPIDQWINGSAPRVRGGGQDTLRTISRALIAFNIIPSWHIQEARSFRYEAKPFYIQRNPKTKVAEYVGIPVGWNCITSGYSSSEYWMLERAIVSLMLGGIDYLIGERNGDLYLFRRGGVVVDDDPDDMPDSPSIAREALKG